MQNYQTGKIKTIQEILGTEILKKEKLKNKLEGLGLQDMDVYKNLNQGVAEMKHLYGSFQDISNASEEKANNLISQAQQYLTTFSDYAMENNKNITNQMQEVANNAVATSRATTTRGGLPNEATALTTKSILDNAALSKAEQNNLTNQQLQAAAQQFIDQAAKINDSNITTQLNSRNLAYSHKEINGVNNPTKQSSGGSAGSGGSSSSTSVTNKNKKENANTPKKVKPLSEWTEEEIKQWYKTEYPNNPLIYDNIKPELRVKLIEDYLKNNKGVVQSAPAVTQPEEKNNPSPTNQQLYTPNDTEQLFTPNDPKKQYMPKTAPIDYGDIQNISSTISNIQSAAKKSFTYDEIIKLVKQSHPALGVKPGFEVAVQEILKRQK